MIKSNKQHLLYFSEVVLLFLNTITALDYSVWVCYYVYFRKSGFVRMYTNKHFISLFTPIHIDKTLYALRATLSLYKQTN